VREACLRFGKVSKAEASFTHSPALRDFANQATGMRNGRQLRAERATTRASDSSRARGQAQSKTYRDFVTADVPQRGFGLRLSSGAFMTLSEARPKNWTSPWSSGEFH